GPDTPQNNANPFMIYLKEEDKNNINEVYIRKRRKVEKNETSKVQNIVVNDPQAESSKISKVKKKRNSLQGPRFHKPTIVTAQYADDRKFRTIALYCQANINRITTNIILDSSSARKVENLSINIGEYSLSINVVVADTDIYSAIVDVKIQVSIEFRHVTRIPRVEAISKKKTKEESSDKSKSEYESSSESDKSTEYEDKQLEEKIYTLNLWQKIEKKNLKQMYKIEDSFDSFPKLNVGELDEKQQEEFYNLVNEYIDIFAQNDSNLGRTNKI
ncbi:34850_t:CDS:2, partial [Racocetra persica]